MTHEMIIAGFGGQGVLSMGMTISYAAMLEGKEISWMPSYGPEMRGGTANCIVIVSDKKISSPIITEFNTAIVLNQPSMDKFSNAVRPGGLLLYDSTNIPTPSNRTDITVLGIPAAEEAARLDNLRVANMVLLGAFLSITGTIDAASIPEALKKVLPERYHNLLPLNEKALHLGMNYSEPLIQT